MAPVTELDVWMPDFRNKLNLKGRDEIALIIPTFTEHMI